MTLYGASLIFSLLFLGIIFAVVGRRVWRGESGLDGGVPPEWWFLGDTTWRGVARAYIATGPFVLVIFTGGLVAEFTDAYDAGMAIAVSGMLLGAVVHGGIVLFNRPQAFVPPHLRDEPGALAERRARRRRRVAG